ncbi:MAG: hypothetical protein IT373_36405 [Polyangiaceae bacterium]|nr:hypothetical protein [Polyangiaceae bacterium]
MAQASILTTWGTVHVGRESMGLRVFQEVLTYYESAKAAGKLEDFKVGLCEAGDVGALSGYMVAEGSTAQVQAMFADEAFKRLVAKATHVVSFSMVSCSTGTAIPASIERLLGVRKELGIT